MQKDVTWLQILYFGRRDEGAGGMKDTVSGCSIEEAMRLIGGR
jgi:hypothetical protein